LVLLAPAEGKEFGSNSKILPPVHLGQRPTRYPPASLLDAQTGRTEAHSPRFVGYVLLSWQLLTK